MLKKKEPQPYLTLTREAKEAVLNMEINKLTDKKGVKNPITVLDLDQMYFKDESVQAYDAYETFEKFVRPHDMNIEDYVIKFEQLHFKDKSP